MQPLSILHLISARHYVGEAARVVDLAQAQIEAGHRVHVVARAGHSVLHEAGRRGVPSSPAFMESRFSPRRDTADIRTLRRLLRESEADILHAHRGKDHWLGAAALVGSFRATPLIRTRHVVTPIKPHLFNRHLYGKATAGMICVSEAVKRAVLESLPDYARPLRVIPGGMRTAHLSGDWTDAGARLRETLDIAPERPLLTVIARIARVKGQLWVLRALPRILERHPAAVLLFAHNRENRHYRAEMDATARELGVTQAVRHLGPQEHIAPILQATDVSVVASVGSEGWSRVAVESMHMRRPVVATTVGSLPEIVADGVSGRLVPPREPEQLADAVNALLDDPDLRTRYGAAAGERARTFTAERMAAAVVDFYRERREDRPA